MAVIAPMVLAAGVFIVLDRPTIKVPAVLPPPDTALRSTKVESSYITPLPMPKALLPVIAPKAVAARQLGPGIFKCEEAGGAVTYSEYPCGDGKVIDTKPTSGGFGQNWSISVKGR
ncbi:MAG TPA: hypothetical protein VM937_01610 [Burkholderiaceae bacterium]|jgi:hypothetical protein|nr:hypothetical protein [Burkholderiaceae bacterium]